MILSSISDTWEWASTIPFYLFGKGGYVLGSVGLSVCLFVCLSVDNITQKVMNGLG